MLAEGAQGPKGIGGWLIIPLIGLLLMPLKLLFSLHNDFLPIFQEGYWEVLTTPGAEAYHHLWAPLLIFEIVGNVFFVLFDLVLLYLLFTKHHLFPKLFIAFLASNVVFVTADYFAADLIPAIAAQSDPEALRELRRTIVGALIWIPYMLRSERVRNTFLKPGTVIEDSPALAVRA